MTTQLQAFSHEDCMLIHAPTGRDAALTRTVLTAAGVSAICCKDLDEVCRYLEDGAGALLVVEEAVEADQENCLDDWLQDQPHWSDLPVLFLARPGADSASVARAMDRLGNVTVLERPLRVSALVSAVRTALRARSRQYQTRAHLRRLEERERELRENHRRKDQFLAVLAHELRNPLAPIRNSLHILRLTNRDDPVAERVGTMMQRQVDHLVRLVDDLVEVSRITGGKVELKLEDIELATVVQSAIETSQPLIDAADHHLVVTLPEAPVTVAGDPIRLAQVLANLLNNAARYTEPGGEIRVTVRRDEDEGTITVRDNGTGIPSGMLPRIFDLFTQVDRPPGRAQGGLGIGLTLVKSLVEMHRGTVTAHSEGLGKGSEFVVHLPLAKVAAHEDGSAPVATTTPPQLLPRVLVVDDNHDAAESLGTLLQLMGVEARVEYDGVSALMAMEEYRPSAVLLDIGMPDMDGREVARRIREKPEFDDVLLIALTGWGQEADRRRTLEAGFDYHMIKPADLNALQTMLSTPRPGGVKGASP